MKNLLTLLQLSIIAVFIGIFFFTPIPKSPAAITFAAVISVLTVISALRAAAETRRLQNKVTHLARELGVASSRISSVSQEIGITIDENNAYSSDLFDQTRVMASLTSDVNLHIGETIRQVKGLITFSDEMRDTAARLNETSSASFDTVQSSISEILGIVDTINEIKVTSGRASASMDRLTAAAGEVLAIIGKINDISRQMHLISLNASVEAARAGRNGSGFAVVAKEFQMLAETTDLSIKDISKLIHTMQNEVTDVSAVVKENNDRVDEGVLRSRNVEKNLKNINASFTSVADMVRQVSTLSDDEARLAEEISQQIDEVEVLIGETGSHVESVYNAALNQKKGIENISDMGSKLNSASGELLAASGSAGSEATEALDEKTSDLCRRFFPLMKSELCSAPDIVQKDPETHAKLLGAFKNRHDLVEAAWTNEPNGRFICSIPAAGIANAAMRDWFQAALKGENFISSIYISGITKNRCVTLSMPCYDASGAVCFIIGVDLNLSLIK
ncbi:chemotaxis protein [Oscillospiraceae bacterium CM]|nr:chemotaxis protein [Oscillospiraceae bacterium CM]